MRFIIVIFLLSTLSGQTFAEEFLGAESSGTDSDGPKGGTTAEEEALKEDDYSQPEKDEYEDTESSVSPGKWSFSLSGGSSSQGRARINAGVGYSESEWTSMQLRASYSRYESTTDPYVGTSMSGAFYYVGHLPNPTIIKPSAGAGPGYSQWKREDSGAVFSENSSVTLNAFWGFALLFTKHFGLNLQRNWVMYLGDSPALFEDHDLTENESSVSNSFGFFAYF
jgi:hypothetical protein